MLRLFAEAVRIRIGKGEDAVVVLDDAALAAQVSRQPGISHRVVIANQYSVTDAEARGDVFGDAGRGAGCGYTGHAARLFHAAHEFLGMFEKRFFQVKSALQTVGLITWQIVGLVTSACRSA